MNDKLASKIISTLYNLLNKHGILIIGNVCKGNKLKVYTEMLGDWYINYRSRQEMINLTENIDKNSKIRIEYEKETKMNIFLIIEKK